MYRTSILVLALVTGSCTSATYTKTNLSPLDTDKAQCHYQAERDLAYARGTLGTYFRGLELEKSCMQAKGYTQG